MCLDEAGDDLEMTCGDAPYDADRLDTAETTANTDMPSAREAAALAPRLTAGGRRSGGKAAAASGRVGKASVGCPPRVGLPRASKTPVKFTAQLRDSRILGENPLTGDVELVPAKVTQLTVSRFFAPRRNAARPQHSQLMGPTKTASALDTARPSALPRWSSVKSDLGVTEINTPANGSCYYFAIGAAKINVCPDQFTCRDRKMRREGGYYRREINLAILARLPDLLTTGTFDHEQICRRFLPAGQPQAELIDRMERHFRAAASASCVEVCPVEYWAHEEELLGTAFWFGEPLFVFEVCPDDRVLLQVFHGDNDKKGSSASLTLGVLSRRLH
ncbi:hypothetical protein P43SY_011685 [Pythium insidiosum]|uniref:OTU domain-containing protein n=1 Tax=Pythium insidiosum TaxID=114742 RepID=A0AAD5Q191_PYTIN|nr:hypothetical protein P43SY_011685 [Pythium insidiosum]